MTEAERPALTDYLVSRVVDDSLQVPDDVADLVSWFVLDTLSVGLAGMAMERGFVGPAARTFVAAASPGRSLAMPLAVTSDAASAAAATAAAIHTIDFDDSYLEGVKAHLSTTLVPVVLAVGADVGASGADVVDAYARGFEVAARLGHVVVPSHLVRWHPTGTLGVVGSAAAAARLHRLSAAQAAAALSLAGDRGAGGRFFVHAGDATKPLHAAFAAHDGVLCTALARAGVEGPARFFEGPKGFVETFSDEAAVVPADDGRWLARDNSTKFYPAMHGLHAAIALAERSVADRGGARADDVVRVTVHQCTGRAHMGRIWRPDSPLAARLSMPYAVAVSLLDGECGLAQFAAERMRDADVLALMDKVVIEPSDALEQEYGARIATRLVVDYADGTVTDETYTDPVGTPRRPATTDQRRAKYDRLLDGIVDDADRAELFDAVRELPAATSLERLFAAVASAAKSVGV